MALPTLVSQAIAPLRVTLRVLLTSFGSSLAVACCTLRAGPAVTKLHCCAGVRHSSVPRWPPDPCHSCRSTWECTRIVRGPTIGGRRCARQLDIVCGDVDRRRRTFTVSCLLVHRFGFQLRLDRLVLKYFRSCPAIQQAPNTRLGHHGDAKFFGMTLDGEPHTAGLGHTVDAKSAGRCLLTASINDLGHLIKVAPECWRCGVQGVPPSTQTHMYLPCSR